MIINLRPMSESDIEQVYLIETKTHITPWDKKIIRDCVWIGYDCRILELNQDNHTQIAGYIISRIKNRVCHILNLCIDKPLQMQGLGRALLVIFLSLLEQKDVVDSIILEVRQSNKVALHLYSSFGFKEIEIKKEYYKDKEDAIILKKLLK